jgi:uncharacterized protein YqgC (DUF456 family)
MTGFGPGFEVLLQAMVLFVMLFGLVGLIVPIFPGLTVMWLAALFFALVQAANGQMAWIDWTLFGLITALMIGGNVVDNIIIAKKMREVSIPWSSILLSYLAGIVVSFIFTPLIGLVAAPLALLGLEYLRRKDRQAAVIATKAYVTGWGWAFAARFSIGVVMTGLWMGWAWF